MFKVIGRLLLGVAASVGMAIAAPSEAGAWFKVHNDTDLTINVAHAWDSMDGQFCGYFDACGGGGTANWRVKGWWVIAAGGTKTVQSEDYDNAYHQYFAYDSTSTYFWQGGGSTFRTQSAAFEYCGNHALGTARVFKWLSNYRCCGAVCNGPTNFTLNLTL